MNLALNHLPVKCRLNVVSVPASREESICVYYLLRRTDRNDAEKIDSSVWAFELGCHHFSKGLTAGRDEDDCFTQSILNL